MTWTVADVDRSIPACFEQRRREHAGRAAIAGTGWQPTYEQLDASSNRLALAVLERTGPGGARVATLLRHDAPLIAAVLGVLKAGKSAVALNPGDPPARLDQIRRDAEPALLLTEERLRPLALASGFPPESMVSVAERPDSSAHPTAGVAVGADDLAFLIYTSGSTGTPKAVMQTHRNVLHNVLRQTRGLGLRSEDRYALLAAVGGGHGVGVVWSALMNGATVCPFPVMERGVTGLGDWLERHEVSVLGCASTLFRNFVRTLDGRRLSGVRLVRLASEPALLGDLEAHRRHFAGDCELFNTFSSSETGNIARCRITEELDLSDGRLPIGQPTEGIEVALLDDAGVEVAPGEVGEIVVRSRYISPGYWRDEAQTAVRFGADPQDPHVRLFRTGDLGRMRPDGLLAALGRTDLQVKVRGNRVGLAGIERALAALPGVEAAAVSTRVSARGDTLLSAFLVTRGGGARELGPLREQLRTVLPGHAIPTAFVFLDSLPLTPNGKVDRDQLARLAPSAPSTGEPPEGELEESLATVWADALELDSVGRDDGFLDMGGESLTAALVAARVHETFAVRLELSVFAENRTIEEMALLVTELRAAVAASPAPGPSLRPAGRSQPLPLSFAQQETWGGTGVHGSVAYNVAVPVRIVGELDVQALLRGVDQIVARHEIMRTTFELRDGHPVQVVHQELAPELHVEDLRDAPDPAAKADEILSREALVAFDLERGPLLRFWLLRIGEHEHRLLRVNHHIISDAWSWKVFFEELSVLYPAHVEGKPPILPALPVQYGDFAVWERQNLDPSSALYREHLDWWTSALESAPVAPVRLPFQRAQPAPQATAAEGVIRWGIDAETARRLDQVGRESAATHTMVRLALFVALLALDTGREDVIVGMMMGTRRLAELFSLFGFFSDRTTLRIPGAGDWSFRRWLACVRARVLETRDHTTLPYPVLVPALAARDVPVPTIETLFAPAGVSPWISFGGLEITRLKRFYEAMPWEFTFAVDRWRERDGNVASFNAVKHDPEGVLAFIERYRRLAAAVSREPDTPVRELARA